MAKLDLDALRALATDNGFPNPERAAAVAMAESGGDPLSMGDQGTSIGLWQIHVPAHPEVDASLLTDPTYNAQQAFRISKSGVDWSPWTTFRNGAYAQYMTGGKAAAPAAAAGNVSPWLVLLALYLVGRR